MNETAIKVDYEGRKVEKKPVEISFHDSGLMAEHSMVCASCLKRPAVLDCSNGGFNPCWTCQRLGWRTLKLSPAWQRILRFFGILKA